ncbi:MAG: S9 family peptidase [Minwuia sp.]|nr:S9 family peptidase [Minwuia sp.]
MTDPILTDTPAAPVAALRPRALTAHGDTREDPWYWLRDENWREVMRDPAVLDPDIRAYLEAENAYADAQLADVSDLRATLFGELKGRLKQDDSSVPAPDGPFAYYMRYQPGAEHPQYCRMPRAGGETEVLLDGDSMAEGHAFFRLGALRPSPDHKLLAVSCDTKGSELYGMQIIDIASGDIVETGPAGTSGEVVWAADSTHYFYTRLNDDLRPDSAFCHRLGSPVDSDDLIYREPDSGYYLGIDNGESRRFLYITSSASEMTEVRVLPTDLSTMEPRLIAARRDGHDYDVTDQADRFIIRTNREGAIDYKLMTTPIDQADEAHWTDIVPARDGRLLRAVRAFSNWLVHLETVNALPRIVVTDTASGEQHSIAFDEEAYSIGIAGGEYVSDTVRFSYSSPTTPEQTFDYNMRTRQRVLVKTQEIPSGHDAADYVVRRLQAVADDGMEIPLTLLHHRQTPPGADTPLLLYGYGSYGMSMPASFSPHRLSLVNRGFTYVIAHIRGGMEKGYHWYTDGKLLNKRNTFTDFVAAGRSLVDQGLAGSGNIAIHGGSAGGMLVGAAANMAPDLWRAVVAEVPFVDCLTTILDDSLPLTPPEWTEWGNPVTNRDIYDLMKSYSPYDNVAAIAYPAMLITGGLTDPRVTYWEPAKWAAKLRATRANDSLLLLQINMDSGHGGAAGRFDKLHEIARNHAFLLKVFGKVQEG